MHGKLVDITQKEKKAEMDTTTRDTIQGMALAFRIGDQPRTGKSYLSPEFQFKTFAQHAAANDGRLLFTRSVGMKRGVEEQADQLIAFTRCSDLALYGRIVGSGIGYDRSRWNPDDPYQMPEPWASTPARRWYKLDGARLARIDLEDFTTVVNNRVMPLSEASAMPGRSAYLATPRHGEAVLPTVDEEDTERIMLESNLMDRTAIIITAGRLFDRLGYETVSRRIGGIDCTVAYNRFDAPTFRDVCMSHAAANEGRILIPFGTNLTVRNLYRCGRFIMLFRDNGYIEGRIHEAGSPWVNTMVDEKYTPPEGLRMTKEKLWVKLDGLTDGDDFDPEGWAVYASQMSNGRQTLAERLRTSNNTFSIAVKEQ